MMPKSRNPEVEDRREEHDLAESSNAVLVDHLGTRDAAVATSLRPVAEVCEKRCRTRELRAPELSDHRDHLWSGGPSARAGSLGRLVLPPMASRLRPSWR